MRRWIGPVVVCAVAIAACIGSAKLSETQQATITIMSPSGTSYDFGNVPVGMVGNTNPDYYFTLAPQSSFDDDTVTDISPYQCSTDFKVTYSAPLPVRLYCGGVGGSGTGTCTSFGFGAKFSPSFSGMQSCNVRITYTPTSGGGSNGTGTSYAYVMLTGTGGASQYAWSVSPTAIDFSDVPTSGSATRSVNVINKGTANLDVTTQLGDGVDYTINPSASTTITPGSTQVYSVVCHPQAGPHSTIVTLDSQAGAQDITLACNGVTTSVDVTPNPIDVGSVLVGSGPRVVAVSIRNSGSTSLLLSNFAFDPGTSADITYTQAPGSYAVAAGSAVNVSVTYSAASEHDPATPLGTMTFSWSGSASQGVSHTSITGGAQPGMIGTNPASVEFGPICLSQGAVDKPVSIYTSAAGPVSVMMLTPPQNAAFTVTPAMALPHTIPGHTNPGLDLTTRAQPSAPGELTDSFVIQTNIPGAGSATTIALHAIALPAGVAATPGDLKFGAVRVGMASSAKEIVLSNCGSGDLMVTGAHVEGTDLGEFALVSPDVAKTLHPGDSESFLVIMNPHAAGPKTATFVIEHSAGTTPVTLEGDAFAGSDTGGKDRETYYGCDAGQGGATWWPLAFAVGLFARRRRPRS